MFLLSGVARYLFIPLAEAVVFAMLASYLLSRTLVPTVAMYLNRHHDPDYKPAAPGTKIFARIHAAFKGAAWTGCATPSAPCWPPEHRPSIFIPVFLGGNGLVFLLVPWLGRVSSIRSLGPVQSAFPHQTTTHRGDGAPAPLSKLPSAASCRRTKSPA